MDRKHLAIGSLFLAASMAAFYWNAQQAAQAQAAAHAAVPASPAPAAPVAPAPAPALVPATRTPSAPDPVFEPERPVRLANAFLDVTLTNHGGSVRSAQLLGHKAEQGAKDNVVFNAQASDAALEVHIPDPATAKPVPVRVALSPQPASADGWVRFSGQLPDGTKLTRAYRLRPADAEARGADDGHLLEFSVALTPAPGKPAPKFWLSTGTWLPEPADTTHLFQSILVADLEETSHVGLSEFTDSAGFLGMFAHKASAEYPFVAAGGVHRWAAAANQYFVASLCPDPAQRGARSEVVALPVTLAEGSRSVRALASWEGVVAADGTRSLAGTLYIGPKHYSRLAALPEEQVDTLQFVELFGFIGIAWMAKLLLAALGGVHALTSLLPGSWGWAILVLTLIIKLLTWPLTSAQLKAGKKMAQFAKPMQEIREKHAKNPEKMQKEMMKLYQEHGINPLAGCLPILIQIPIFFGLYSAFQTAPEMRLESFLWIADLARADTVAHLGSFPINPLPVLMGATMWYSMRMTPMPNQDETMKTVMTIMMLMFPVICYTMPAALTLYWTFQNILQIAQTWLLKRNETAAPAPAKG
ncbi:MAG: YidC/Oxa1 family insertase periplasmic-domain containing protein [Opitutia bacterium]|jgi:YidC/Oxa1 family membrane protein insertase